MANEKFIDISIELKKEEALGHLRAIKLIMSKFRLIIGGKFKIDSQDSSDRRVLSILKVSLNEKSIARLSVFLMRIKEIFSEVKIDIKDSPPLKKSLPPD